MKKISVIIRAYNEERYIGKLLSGIQQQTLKNVEIILVDSGSTDATVSIASHYPVNIVKISPGEFSFGRALNIGCAAATGEYIVAASAHVYPLYNDWLENLTEPFRDEEVVLSYGKQRGNDITRFSEHQVFSKWFPEESDFDQSYPFCNNANAAIRQSLWQQIPYDEELTGLEDLDWATRAMKKGHKIAYVAEAPIIHVHDETPSEIYNRYRREGIAFKNIFPEETFSFFDFMKLFFFNIYNDCKHALQKGVFLKNYIDILMFRFMQFWGTYKGFDQRGELSSRLKRRFYYPNRSVKRQKENLKSFSSDRKIDYSKTQEKAINESLS